MNHQHMNGGIAVDGWGRSSVAGIHAGGEAAGTHGVTRHGGAALNAGPLFGTRVAEHVAASGVADTPSVTECAEALHDEIQARMSDSAGILCSADTVANALNDSRALNEKIARDGIVAARATESARVVQWQQMAMASEAVLAAPDHCIRHGGGSRGARAICNPAGEALPAARTGPLQDCRFRKENPRDRDRQLVVRLQTGEIMVSARPVRSFDEAAKPFFERDWPAWLTGAILDLEAAQP